MADWTANTDFGALNATREPVFRPSREAAAAGLRAEPRATRPEEPAPLSPGVAALAQYNAGHGGPLAKARLAVWTGGGVLSLALMAGLGVWGYKLILRDVLGLPVVAAEEGPMRVLPADPQGEVVPSQGLTVNAIPAAGTAAPPSDVLVLAPQAPGLAEEDLMVVQTRAEADEVMPASVVSAVAADPLALVEAGTEPPAAPLPQPMASLDAAPTPVAPIAAPAPTLAAGAVAPGAEAARLVAALLPSDRPMTAAEILAYADQVAAGSQTFAPLPPGAAVAAPTDAAPPALSETVLAPAAAPAADVPVPVVTAPVAPPAVASVPLRPALRPVTLRAAPVAAEAPVAASATPATAPVVATAEAPPPPAAASLPAGTNLVQLGAFDSAEVAAAEWNRLQGRFGEFLGSRERVIQEAQSEGRTFFRLRALGFADRADARRLCAALTAEDAACIPVTVD